MKKFSLHDLNKKCIVKPWGFEFELFSNKISAVWCLYIKKNSSTSLHCHPTKKTGYLLVSGEVEIEFLSSKIRLVAGQKINFRPGLFHKTTALSENVFVLEIETPINKNDLVRLEDISGRIDSAYETQEACLAEILIQQELISHFEIGDSLDSMRISKCNLQYKEILPGQLINFMEINKNSIIMILEGGLLAKSQHKSIKQPVHFASAGDVINDLNLSKLIPLIDINSRFTALVCTSHNDYE
jgi:hypothetical protein